MPSLTPSTGSSPASQIAHLANGGFAVVVAGLWLYAIIGYSGDGRTEGLLLGGAITGTCLVAMIGIAAWLYGRFTVQHQRMDAASEARAEKNAQTLSDIVDRLGVIEVALATRIDGVESALAARVVAESQALQQLVQQAITAVRTEYAVDRRELVANLEILSARIDKINTEYPSDLAIKMYTESFAMYSKEILPKLAEVLAAAGRPDIAENVRQITHHRRN